MKSEFLRELKSRGIFKDCTNLTSLDELLVSGEKKCGYIGFDLTAPSLHVGSLVQIMILRLMKKHNIEPIVLLGSATTKIGDPSDKDEMRKMLDEKTIMENKESIKLCISQFIEGITFVDNDEWLGNIKYMEFLREYGPVFSINTMLKLDSVKRRLDRQQHLSFLEFNYMLLQSYDFAELYRRYGCRIQFGGSEQWSNIINGVELGRRLGFKELYGLTTNLIVTNDGKKMGKTVKGAIWLKKEMLPIYDYWQFWRNTRDEDVFKFLKLFTDLSLEQIAKLEKEDINGMKILLANKATEICHGEQEAIYASSKAQKIFDNKLDEMDTITISKEMFSFSLYKFITDYVVKDMTGNQVKRLILQGAVKLDDKAMKDPKILLRDIEFSSGAAKLSVGKKNHYKIVRL